MKAHKGVMCYQQNICSLLNVFGVFGKKLKANLGVRCYLHIFFSFLKVLNVIKIIIEDIMCFLGVIGIFLSPQSLICWISQHYSPYH